MSRTVMDIWPQEVSGRDLACQPIATDSFCPHFRCSPHDRSDVCRSHQNGNTEWVNVQGGEVDGKQTEVSVTCGTEMRWPFEAPTNCVLELM